MLVLEAPMTAGVPMLREELLPVLQELLSCLSSKVTEIVNIWLAKSV